MIELDGSYQEGGGALVRFALALSTLTSQEFKVINIRQGRKDSGLKAQHLQAIKALKEICNAETNDIELGSTQLYFKPGKIKGGIYNIDIGTAGSISLLLQALILPCLFAPSKVTLNVKGGTCGKWQASVDYLQNVLLPQIKRFTEKMELKILKRGYYPKGGGEIKLEINPRFKLKDYDNFSSLQEEMTLKTAKINLTNQGQLEQVRGVINLSEELHAKEVGERIKNSIESSLNDLNAPINIRVDYVNSLSVGGEVVIWGIFSNNSKVDYDNPVILAADCLIEKGKSSEQIGKEVSDRLKEIVSSETAVDKYLADQLISFMALLPGSEIMVKEISDHLHTNIYVAEKFLNVGFKINNDIISVESKDL